ncbi:hypothetical protein TNCV_1724981 [Trichonephila clavipes]|nr:hypothetical protein TNCV_1724981 [Trichonephila clavipes]
MFDPSSFANPTPLAHADTSRDVLPKQVQPPRAWHHSKRMHRWVVIKGSTLNGHRDPKSPLASNLRMVQEDTGDPNEGATCTWIVQLVERVLFLRCGGLLDDWFVESALSLVFV